jgi:hypothetical protein
MKPNEIKLFVYVTVGLSTIFWGSTHFINDTPLLSYPSLKALNISTSIVVSMWACFFSWGWRWPCVQKLIYRPNLNGTWIGQFKSDWKDEQGKGVPPSQFVLVIRQTFFSISVRAYSEKQKTSSYVESLILDDERGTKLLAYLYAEKRAAGIIHDPRQGAADLELTEKYNCRVLEGEFWTSAGTTGFVRVKQACAKLYVESFDQAVGQWPDSLQWASV